MKRNSKKLIAVVVYTLLLCVLLRTEAILIFSLQHIGIFLIGGILLCIPYLEKKIKWRDFRQIFKQNAITAGCLETFMLIFVSMTQKNVPLDRLLPDLALDLRPLFYGYVCYVVLKEEPENSDLKTNKEPMDQEEEEALDFSKLTRQEKVVAKLAGQGLSNREIGEELCISESTVKKHMSNIFEKLEISSRKELRKSLKTKE